MSDGAEGAVGGAEGGVGGAEGGGVELKEEEEWVMLYKDTNKSIHYKCRGSH